MKKTALLLLIISFCIAGWQARAQDLNQREYVVNHFTMEDGLPQSSVNDIIQAKNGYIWLATYGGLVRFDGNTFTTFNRGNVPGMSADRILRIYEAEDGAIWAFPEYPVSSLFRFYKGEVTNFQFEQNPGYLITFDEDKEGRLWLSASKRIYQYKDGEFIDADIIDDQELAEKAREGNGVWITDSEHLYKTIDEKVVLIKESIDKEYNAAIVDIIEYPLNSGDLFGATIDRGIAWDADGKIKNFGSNAGLPNDNALRFKPFYDGSLFTMVFSHIYYWTGSGFNVFRPDKLPKNIDLKSILLDSEGNYWVGTSANGLFQLRPSAISMIDSDDGLENEKMLSLSIDEDGTGILSTNCGGIYDWDGEKANYSKLQNYLDGGCNWAVLHDSKGRYWIGGGALYMTESIDEPGKTFTEEDGISAVPVFLLYEDSKGNIWVANMAGVYKYDGSTFQHYSMENGLKVNDNRALLESSDGTIWLAAGGGLNFIKDDQVYFHPLIDKGQQDIEREPNIRAIYEDHEGLLWIGTYGNGIYVIRKDTIQHITQQDGLFDNVVSHIIEDETGNFWMGSNRGISSVKRNELLDYLDGTIDEFWVSTFGVADGMKSAETNGGFQPSANIDGEGRIYFPTVAGVAVVDTRKIKTNDILPPVYIENLRTFDSTLVVQDSIVLDYNTPFLEIGYTAISFTEPEKVQFKYRLNGLDNSWIDVGNRRTALYSRIPPGNYTFEVQASNNDGIWNTEGASITIVIQPPFWQTNWFYVLIGFLLLTTGPGIYYMRVQRLKKENERQKKFTEQLIDSQEQERRRIAAELHDGLGQQILVIKNRVELAKYSVDNPGEIKQQLDEILQSAVHSIQDVRTISHGLRPVHLEKFGLTEALNNLFEELEQVTEIKWSHYIDDIDELIPKEKEINLYRVVQEGTKNIIKHSSAFTASIFVRRLDDEIRITLIDDGKGFNILNRDSFTGFGFTGMQERIQTLGGTLEFESEPGDGTTINIRIPILNNG